MEAHIKGHANDIPDDENCEDAATDKSSIQNLTENKHSILLNTPMSPSPNMNTANNSVVTKYENNENSNHQLLNFAEQFSIMNEVTPTPTVTVYPDTPKDSEASSEQNSDGDDITYMNMYSRFEQSVVNQYGINSGVNSALLAVASITASATLQPVSPTSNSSNLSNNANHLTTLKTIQQSTLTTGLSQNGFDASQMSLARNNTYFESSSSQQPNDYK